MLSRICCRRSSSSWMKYRAHLDRCTMDDSVTTHVKKCVCDSSGTACVTILEISHAAVIVCRVCELKTSPDGTTECGAHELTLRAGDESSNKNNKKKKNKQQPGRD